MLTLTKTAGTKLTNKAAKLKSLNEEGFMLENHEGEELFEFDLIREYFLGKTVKITFEEVNKENIDV